MDVEKPLLSSPRLDQDVITQSTYRRRIGESWSRLIFVFSCSFLAACFVSNIFNTTLNVNESASCDDPKLGYRCRPSISQAWGQYSPYFSVPSEIPDELPSDCEITFAQVLSRHGARNPTLKRTLLYSSTVVKIQSTAQNFTGKYEFLRNYRYNLGADQLNDFGRQQLKYSGADFYERYNKLTRETTPFIRSAGQRRVVESADAWIEGFHGAKQSDKSASKDKDYPYDKIIIYEGPDFNNTLCHGRCINIELGPMSNIRKDAKDAWINVYGPPILARLRQDLPDSFLKMEDVHNLMSMCPFDTISTASGTISPFCDIFTDDEWQQYNQLENLEKFYGWGKGNPLGPTNGVGFANELIARLTHRPVNDSTTTNTTLDTDPKTFPLDKSHKLFADFSHDNDLTAAFFALGLFDDTPMLSITQIDDLAYTKGWSSARTVPFAARAYFEKMKCTSKGDEELVRVIVNDRVLPMLNCGGDQLGRCRLGDFIDGLGFARDGGRWEQCFVPAYDPRVVFPDGSVAGSRNRSDSDEMVIDW